MKKGGPGQGLWARVRIITWAWALSDGIGLIIMDQGFCAFVKFRFWYKYK